MTAVPDIILLRSSGLRRRLSCRTALAHPLAAMLAHGLPTGPSFSSGNEAVVIGIEAGEGLFRTGLGVGDDDRAAGFVTAHAAMTPAGAAARVMGAGTPTSATFLPSLAGTVELGAAHGTVVVRVQPVEMSVGATGHTCLSAGTALVGGHRSIAVDVGGDQALHALTDELGLADTAVAIDVSAHAAGRSLLGERRATRDGEGKGSKAAHHKCLSHLFDLHGRQTRPVSLSGE
ncbi:MAG: hypothetical protein ACOH1E_05385 [Brevundimonas sp.]